MNKNYFLRLVFCSVGMFILLTGCGLKYTVKDPVASTVIYDAQNVSQTVLTIVDDRKGMDAIFLPTQLGAGAKMSETGIVTLENIQDPIAYFSVQLEKELNTRQIPVKCIVGKSAGGLSLVIHKYQIASVRATGFSPWETLHSFSGTLIKDGQKISVKSYFYNGRMPVWSMDEILEPCFNIPISVLIKDVASKINRTAFALKVSDQKVTSLVEEVDAGIAKKDSETFWKVLELGFTNNPLAVDPLKRFAQTGDEFFKACAISSIGTLEATGEVEFLKKSYREGTYNDCYMAVKALGDLAIPEAVQVLKDIKNDPRYEKEAGLKYGVDLYLQ